MLSPRAPSVRAPQSTSLSASPTPCSCNEEVSALWKQISVMSHVPFNLIITASTQVVDISVESRECASCAFFDKGGRVHGMLVLLFGRIVDLLEAAILTYTGPEDCVPTKVRDPNLDLVGHRTNSFLVVQRREQPAMDVVCLPSVMALGNFTLSEQQSKQLALDMVGRTLKNLGAVLQHMPRQDGKVDEIFMRVMRLLGLSTSLQ